MPTSQNRRLSVPLPLQTGLEHRGVLGAGEGSLYPPAGAFEALGGREAVARLVEGLYDRIETDAVLRPAFGRDLTPEREKQKRFFEEWLGGSAGYFHAEWPPGLKAAHGAVSISRGMAERWLAHFLESLAGAAQDPAVISQIQPCVSRLALGLVNRPDEPAPGERLRCSSTGADLGEFLRGVQSEQAPRVSLREGSRLLLLAAVRGKVEAVQELLRQGVDPNAPALLPGSERTVSGLPLLPITPLCGALGRRRAAVVELLMQHGAQYDLFTAACVGDLEAVEALLDRAPELVNAQDPASDVARVTPLMHAVLSGQSGVAQLLLLRGATVGVNGVRLIRAAANRGDAALTDLLLAYGGDPSSLGPGRWVLYPDIAERLLARGANVNHGPERSWIGLCCTGNSGHPENLPLARALLRCGADVSARYGGGTALHCAAKAGFARVVEALIEHGADVNALTDRGQTPLDLLESAGKSVDVEPVRRVLIAHGARRRTR